MKLVHMSDHDLEYVYNQMCTKILQKEWKFSEPYLTQHLLDHLTPGGEGGQICPQAFSWAPGGNHLLKNGLKIKFPQKSSDNDPV